MSRMHFLVLSLFPTARPLTASAATKPPGACRARWNPTPETAWHDAMLAVIRQLAAACPFALKSPQHACSVYVS
jgi:hypothetical protein